MLLMSLARKLRHIFLPHQSNNHKPKLLHSSGLMSLKLFLIAIQVVLVVLPRTQYAGVLGYAAQISPSEVIRLTNEKRAQAGLSSLVENSVLSQAALAKGMDMLNKDYWAHVSPDGTQPWSFFVSAGYGYRFAGENLARDFSNASSAVDAWMASPTHKDNLLSGNYKEVGIGVIEGDLNGTDTTIIVQFFGTRYADTVSEPVALVGSNTEEERKEEVLQSSEEGVPEATIAPTKKPVSTPTPKAFVAQAEPSPPVGEEMTGQKSLLSPFSTTRNVSLVVVGLLIIVLIIDASIIKSKKLKRIGGRTFAHISFLGMILSIILILKAGKIL